MKKYAIYILMRKDRKDLLLISVWYASRGNILFPYAPYQAQCQEPQRHPAQVSDVGIFHFNVSGRIEGQSDEINILCSGFKINLCADDFKNFLLACCSRYLALNYTPMNTY